MGVLTKTGISEIGVLDVEESNRIRKYEASTATTNMLYQGVETLERNVMSGFRQQLQAEQYGMFSGQLMTAVKDACLMYAFLARRRASLLKEEMQEGSALFMVHAYLPVTAGASSALLVLSHWKALPEDPFFVPKTVEEKEEFGDVYSSSGKGCSFWTEAC
ncbi:hypothetical protein POM88_019354 [Heracleum sosnowskyi]|uniref:Uncharacterized protein n=1 Tax=Heracleum sosnowskyi TaxID=360622 RepID=A0AAD8IT30_9APIA|nr:hypothetical protein POM88_019354 [Heracleum sosnowskyi]